MKINGLEYKHVYYGIAKSVPYVLCFEKLKNGEVQDSVFILAYKVNTNYCEEIYVHSSTPEQNIVAYKRYLTFAIKSIIKNLIIVSGYGLDIQGENTASNLIYSAVNELLFEGKTNKILNISNDDYSFYFANNKFKMIEDFINMINNFEKFIFTPNKVLTLYESDAIEINFRLMDNLFVNTVTDYTNKGVPFMLCNSVEEYKSFCDYIMNVQKW